MRNFLTTLFMSQGVPMLLGGDEFARTQRGNNNAYCQDNDITWYKWEFDDEQKRLLEFTTKLIALAQGASRICTVASSSRTARFAARSCVMSRGTARMAMSSRTRFGTSPGANPSALCSTATRSE